MRWLRRILSRLAVYSVLAFAASGAVAMAQTGLAPSQASVSEGDAWGGPARLLAAKIASRCGPRASVVLAIRNMSSLAPDDAAAIRRVLHGELRKEGVRIVAAPSAQRAAAAARAEPEPVAITLSENSSGYLWVAEIGHASADSAAPEVVMIAVPRPAESGPAPAAVSLAIRRLLLWEDDEPILDVASVDASSLLVLETQTVSLIRLGSAPAASSAPSPQVTSAPLALERPWPRDPRGRLRLEPESAVPPSGAATPAARPFVTYLPGAECHGALEPRFNLQCSNSDDPWPADPGGDRSSFAPGRNFFEGRLITGAGEEVRVPPFFSSAEVPGAAGDFEVFDGVDGRVRLRTNGRAAASWAGWGSNVAAIKAECARRWLLLADSPSDPAGPDSARAYEINRDAAVPASPAIEFSGPVTALWSEGDGASALAVARNLRTGKYEAYSLSISCGQ